MSAIRLRYVADLNPAIPVAVREAVEREFTFLPMEAIGEDWTVDRSRTRPVRDVLSGYSYFEDGDIIFAKVTPCFENGKAAILSDLTDGSGFGTTEVTVVRSSELANTRFLFYVLNEDRFKQVGIAEMTGAGGLKRVPDRVVRDYEIDLPARGLQDQLVGFLDREIAQIDAFIADQEELIGLLAERRAATISHAVTKGLDSTVPMKDSGLGWLGEVPVHWSVGQLKHLGEVALGKMLQPSESSEEAILAPYLRAANVQPNGRLDLSSVNEMWFSPSELNRLTLRKGDMVIVEGGVGGYGRAAFLASDIDGWAFQNSIIRVRPFGDECDGRFATYAMIYLRSIGYIKMAASVTSMPHFTLDKVEKTAISWPGRAEQSAIADYLDAELIELDATIEDGREAIVLSRERRAALISAAVTGKIDVREHGVVA